MKIAVNTRLLVPNKMDGIGRFTYETMHRIAKMHPTFEFTLIFDRKVEPSTFSFPTNVKVISIFPPARHPILWFIWFEIQLKRFLNKHSFDLFISPEGWVPSGVNCKTLAVIHDLNFEHHPENIIYSHRKFLRYFFPKYVQRSSRIATVSEYSKNDIITTYGVPASKIDVVYNGANAIFKSLSEEEIRNTRNTFFYGNPYFLFVGTLHPRKNLEHLLLGFDQYKKHSKSTTQLVIVGNKKWWPSSLERIYQTMQFKKEVIFVGRLNDEELAQVMGAAEALTYLPYFEGFGIPILEAFQAEVPVITSNVTSMPEVAKGAAMLCNPKDTDAIANAMLKMEQSTELKKELIEKGKKRATDFSWEKTAELLWASMLKTID